MNMDNSLSGADGVKSAGPRGRSWRSGGWRRGFAEKLAVSDLWLEAIEEQEKWNKLSLEEL